MIDTVVDIAVDYLKLTVLLNVIYFTGEYIDLLNGSCCFSDSEMYNKSSYTSLVNNALMYPFYWNITLISSHVICRWFEVLAQA